MREVRHDMIVRKIATPATKPLVSVLTPFYNTAPYLAQCIESVLGQSYAQFEYILVDNCSTDRSYEIAESYARRDPRIRLIRRSKTVPQLRNYNDALAEISDASHYCKIVQADDYIFPQCLELMVQVFEQSESIGLVSSYRLDGNYPCPDGYPFPQPMLTGKEFARLYLRNGNNVFGTQTTVMYRSSMVRECRPFYDELLPNAADLAKCLQILQHWDFGFVHQLLSFTRRDNESLTSLTSSFRPYDLDRYIFVQQYAGEFFEAEEVSAIKRESRRKYYRLLAREALRFREHAFWRHHQTGLKTLPATFDWPYLALQIILQLLWIGSNRGRQYSITWADGSGEKATDNPIQTLTCLDRHPVLTGQVA